ncbi:hypothetical protein ZWY2020_003921 [Hordeum vulgare]|nr:hypothetical protein ZWY2020_003921 [Hordeum vulgare]
MISASCCRAAAIATLLAAAAATAFLTFSLPSSPSVSTTKYTEELSIASSTPPPHPTLATVSPPPAPAKPATSTARPRKREPSYWRMAPEEALRYAKKEIMAAEPVVADPDLYAPLFKNVSQFKRSYQLMERILKVYIYQDGRRPIFHTPPLSGIYASEGWFMKLLKESRRFVVADAAKAHLFYLPYSSQHLRLSLYVPDSHNLRPLAVYLRDFVRASPPSTFWNRTRGADHFLVACHDWLGGIFTPGKDVSLPETTIRTPKRPLRYVGGLPVSRRRILAFFAGNVHGRVRPVLLQHWGKGQDDDMRVYALLPGRVNSPRIVEALYYECVPVIIADNFVLPFSDVLDWSAFSVVVAEKDIPELKRILQGISLRRYVAMHDCVKRLQRHFLWHDRPLGMIYST